MHTTVNTIENEDIIIYSLLCFTVSVPNCLSYVYIHAAYPFVCVCCVFVQLYVCVCV